MKNGYRLTRSWFEFSSVKKEAKVQHTAIFFWIVELNNRLNWKEEFGLPTYESMEVLSIGNKNTYLNALRDLEKWGFIQIIQEAKNQFQSCVIRICRGKNGLAQDTALTQHLNMPVQKSNGIDTGIDTGTAPIVKPVKTTQTNKQINIPFDLFWDQYDKKVGNKIAIEKKWMTLRDSERSATMDILPAYIKSTPDKRFRKNPLTFLNQRAWEDEIIRSSTPNTQTNLTARISHNKDYGTL